MGGHTKDFELVGLRYKSIVVDSISRKEGSNLRTLHCTCDCGESVDVSYSKQLDKQEHFCDCTRREYQRNTIGDRYNNLVIVDIDKDVRTNVITSCDCGNLKSLQFSVLIKGNIKSCGCATQPLDVTGEIFGRLEILSLAPSIKAPNGRINKRVVAKCECGVVKEYIYKDLRRGGTKSCGCYAKSLKVDIVKNNRFNNWTILSEGEPFRYTNSNKAIRTVNVECVCGKKKENIILTSITQGKSKSCGCQGLPKKVKEEKQINPIPTSTEKEQWKEAFGFEGYYISTRGRLFSTKYNSGCFLTTENRVAVSLLINEKYENLNVSKVVYKTFIQNWNENDYTLLHIDENNLNPSLDNLFLARITKTKSDWVTKALNKMTASAREKSGQRRKIITLRRKDIIEQYIKQEGLSTFLKLPMDLTGVDNLLGISVDRIDNDKDYEPGNITLVTRFENMGRRSATFDECVLFCAPLLCGR